MQKSTLITKLEKESGKQNLNLVFKIGDKKTELEKVFKDGDDLVISLKPLKCKCKEPEPEKRGEEKKAETKIKGK